MKHNRGTINAKLRAANTGRGTFQEFANEIEAFFEELQKFRQSYIDYHGNKTVVEVINAILGEK